jgi:hypothetical protein
MARQHPDHAVVEAWAVALSATLNRPITTLQTEGLTAGDFPADRELAITFPDHSHATFRYAFFLVDPASRRVAVFTEHCGYHVFPAVDITIVTVQRTTFYSDDHTLRNTS